MTKPTAEEALEWLAKSSDYTLEYFRSTWECWRPISCGSKCYEGATPLEAIRNAMKGEGE